MSRINCTFDLKPIGQIVKDRGLGLSGRAQIFIDSEVVRLSDPYVPFDTGMLKDSAPLASKYGSGLVMYNTPYAKKQYYNNRGKGLRGQKWFERMKADHRDEIVRGAAKIAGGKAL